MCRITEDTATNVVLHYKNKTAKESWKQSAMKKIATLSRWDFYTITLDDISADELIYFFEFSDGFKSVSLGLENFGEKETIQLHPTFRTHRATPFRRVSLAFENF
jgi:hypothetical protein